VGRREGYKNFGGLLAAVARSPQLQKTFRIVAFGGSPFARSELQEIHSYGFAAGRVVHAQGGDVTLAALYKSAAALVYPSLYEGFGLPPLEAMSYGCPVCVSDTSSIPEVVGEAGEYFNPNEPDDIAHAIERAVFNSERRRLLAEMGRKRAAEFSWTKCAAQTAQVYRYLVSK
jgi:glycosyltransferase involved in cell wall biosynthesis